MPYKDKEKQKAYLATHYKTNKESYNARGKLARKKREEYVNSLKINNPCVDCGQLYHFCQMQYDHIADDKIADINTLIRDRGLEAIKAEIAKCELVCANCHALRTWVRANAHKV